MNRFLYCDQRRFPFFEDYINTFINKLGIKLIIVDDVNTVKYNYTDVYFFIAQLPQCVFFNRRIKAIYINMEQLSRHSYLVYCQTVRSYDIPIIDYSEAIAV